MPRRAYQLFLRAVWCCAVDEATRRKVRVSQLQYTTTREQLQGYFARSHNAEVISVELCAVRADQRHHIRGPAVNNGQAVVEFADADTAQRLIAMGTLRAPGVAYAKRGEGPVLRCGMAG
jgi:hypothetical protein